MYTVSSSDLSQQEHSGGNNVKFSALIRLIITLQINTLTYFYTINYEWSWVA